MRHERGSITKSPATPCAQTGENCSPVVYFSGARQGNTSYALLRHEPFDARQVWIVRIMGQKSSGLASGLAVLSLGHQRLDFEHVRVPGQLTPGEVQPILLDEA